MSLINQIIADLKKNVDVKYKEDSLVFFKGEQNVSSLSVRTPVVRKIAKVYFKDVKNKSKKEIFKLCEELFKKNYTETTTVAIQWISYCKEVLEPADFKMLEKWVDKYIDNWGKCDDFCLSVLSHFIVKFPEYKSNVKSWAKSKNMWKRRVSAVGFIRGGSAWSVHDAYLKDVFDVATILLHDKEDLVQKGYGWMLKVAADNFQKEVFDFVMKNKATMPRTALRYAVEKMPQNLRKQAMSK
ncbi:DNA alkylation repair protein [Candidatus Woesearchaeota archaeon CG10_big_fil_rev_8_21_14_0_10_37_12]|nr:MAG: DNA alkylation repair protein [Candidatus Woesearchaeota archaeon CG10_big_fil_rev_8_21_14_0_10_37_12]